MQREQGSVLGMSALLIAVLVAYGSTTMVRSAVEQQTAQRHARLVSAFQLAEAGIDRAVAELRNDAAWTGTGYTSIGQTGGYEVAVTTLSPTMRSVISTGHHPSNVLSTPGYQQQRVETIVEVQSSSFPYGLFAAQTVTMNSNAQVDSYDSSLGAYGGSNIGQNGDVGSNATGSGTITLNSNAKIKGDAVVGPGGNPTTDIVLNNNAQITGSQGALVAPESLTPPSFPSGSATQALTLNSNQQQTLPAGTYWYTHVELNSNAAVQVTGDVTLYVTDYFQLNSNAQFVTTCGACTVKIYVKGPADPDEPALVLNSNSLLSAGSKPGQLTVAVAGDGTTAGLVQLNSNSKLYGAVNAPLSDVTLNSNSQLFGAALAYEVQLNSNAKVHYDTALAGGSGQGTTTIQLKGWREL